MDLFSKWNISFRFDLALIGLTTSVLQLCSSMPQWKVIKYSRSAVEDKSIYF